MSKVWLVTGSASGLGRNIAEAVLASGDHLVATARDPRRLDDLVEKYGNQIRAAALDVADEKAAQASVQWAVEAFRLASSGVLDETQIHTHMCYAEFNDIIHAVGEMDADVISIETSRSQMELLNAFTQYRYPNGIGPGVYDIHSPRVPDQQEIEDLLRKALCVLAPSQLWVNPDCGLKTRRWEEVRPALTAMVQAARKLRESQDGNSKHLR